MFQQYYINKEAQETKDHKIHTDECKFFPHNRSYLGYYDNCNDAIEKAKTLGYYNVSTCSECCK